VPLLIDSCNLTNIIKQALKEMCLKINKKNERTEVTVSHCGR